MTKTPAAPTNNNATGATASNATPPTTLCMPENCQDVTENDNPVTVCLPLARA